jgi:hypothetical protein
MYSWLSGFTAESNQNQASTSKTPNTDQNCSCGAAFYDEQIYPFTCLNCRRQHSLNLTEQERRDNCPTHTTLKTVPGLDRVGVRPELTLCPTCIHAGYSILPGSLDHDTKLLWRGEPATPMPVCTCHAAHLHRVRCFRCVHEWNEVEPHPASTIHCNKCQVRVADYSRPPKLCRFCTAQGYSLKYGVPRTGTRTVILDRRGTETPRLYSLAY